MSHFSIRFGTACVLVLGLSLLPASGVWAKKASMEAAKRLVVMLGDDGAGIVFGEDPNVLYIVTAKHLLPSNADTVHIRFSTLPHVPFTAKKVDDLWDDDLAVLSIRASGRVGSVSDMLTYKHIGNVSSVEKGSPVFPIAQFRGEPWFVGPSPSNVIGIKSDVVRVEWDLPSGASPKTLSGGALVNADGELLGMIARDGDMDGGVYRIDWIVEELRAKGYPVGLSMQPPLDWFMIAGLGASVIAGGAALHYELQLNDQLDELDSLPTGTRDEILQYNQALADAEDSESSRNTWRAVCAVTAVATTAYAIKKLVVGDPLFHRPSDTWRRLQKAADVSVSASPHGAQVSFAYDF